MIDFSQMAAVSAASGFKNYKKGTGSREIAAQTIGAGEFSTYTIVIPMDNDNAVSQVKVRYTGLDSIWRVIPGFREVSFPTYEIGVREYSVGSLIYFTGSSLSVFTYVVDQTLISSDIPAFTIEVKARLFLAPF